MNTIFTIFKKEIKATLRDRRTLISAIFIPALAMPLLILGITKLQMSLMEKENTKQLKIVLLNAPAPIEGLFHDPKISIIKNVPLAIAKDSVEKENYDAILSFDEQFTSAIDSMQAGKINFYFKSTNLMVEKRVVEKLDQYKEQVMSARFEKFHLAKTILAPLAINNIDVASQKEQIGILVGGFLPYIFIMFCFIGCLYPALDMITGEKEKGTLETLLTVPASRFHILLGKMITIAVIGVCAALMTIGGMFVTLRFLDEIPKEILTTINDILSLRFIIMLFAMLIPLSLFFAGMLSAVVIRANSFKEAQTYVSPMMFVVLVPAMIAIMPGMKLSWQTVWIPILNIALATKEIIAGTIHMSHYITLVLSLVAFAVLALAISIRQFSNEKNILK
jgi:sodium transport system permease protein